MAIVRKRSDLEYLILFLHPKLNFSYHSTFYPANTGISASDYIKRKAAMRVKEVGQEYESPLMSNNNCG